MGWENSISKFKKINNRLKYDDFNVNYKSFGNPRYKPSEYYHIENDLHMEIYFKEEANKMKELVRDHMKSLLKSVGKESLVEKLNFSANDDLVIISINPNASSQEKYMLDKFNNKYSRDLANYKPKKKITKKRK